MSASQDSPVSNGSRTAAGRRGSRRGGTYQNVAFGIAATAAILVVIGLTIRPSGKTPPPSSEVVEKRVEPPVAAPLPQDPASKKNVPRPSPMPTPPEPPPEKTPQPEQPPVQAPPPPPPIGNQFTISVYSRINPILDGLSFPVDDAVLGQLADGEISAQVVFTGTVLPKGRFTLEWQMDGISSGPKPMSLNQVVKYNAEPTVGAYRLILRLDKTELKTFTFRISPARRSPVNQERLPL